jgi:hypothetical protein
MGVAVSEPMPDLPISLARFDLGEWVPPETGLFGREGIAVYRHAHARWKQARVAWARAHGVDPKSLPGPGGPKPYPQVRQIFRG